MLTVLSTALAGAAPIIGGQGAFKYQYMPDLLKAPAGANMVNCHGLVTGAHLASRPKRILRRALCSSAACRCADAASPPRRCMVSPSAVAAAAATAAAAAACAPAQIRTRTST